MKGKLFGNVVIALVVCSLAFLNRAVTQTVTVDFNNTTDLGSLFNSTVPVFTNIGTGGLSNSGSVNNATGQSDLWTYITGIPTTGEGTLYTVSAYFYNVVNNGYFGLGFSTTSSSDVVGNGSSTSGLGMYTHSGGGGFFLSTADSARDYSGDILQDNEWYKVIFTVLVRGNSLFDLKYQVWQSDSAGVLRDMLVEETMNDVVNPDASSALTIYGYFSAVFQRVLSVDNFEVTIQALPIQLASFTAMPVSGSSVTLNWKTASEVKNYGFEVQRSAVARTGFSSISNLISGHGTSVTGFNYSFTDKAPSAGAQYYRLKQIDLNGVLHYSDAVTIGIVSAPQMQIPAVFSLNQNYPNPFNPSTRISYGLPKNSNVTLRVYNTLGQEVAVLQNGDQDAGYHEVIFDGTRLGSGVYFYRIQAGTFVESMKLLLLR
jgi:hypothetical protein